MSLAIGNVGKQVWQSAVGRYCRVAEDPHASSTANHHPAIACGSAVDSPILLNNQQAQQARFNIGIFRRAVDEM